MSQRPTSPESHPEGRTPAIQERPETGVADVDEVMASVEQLDGRPVEDHVGVFEGAHERLRRALDTP